MYAILNLTFVRRITQLSLILCGLTIFLSTNSNHDYSDLQLQQSLAVAQKALNVYQRSAPEQEFPIMLEFLHYYRSWYQAVTPAPMELIRHLSPAALKFIAQLKAIAQTFTRAPQNIPGSSRLTEQGEQFYEAVMRMAQSQLIDKQMAKIMVIPHLQTRLV